MLKADLHVHTQYSMDCNSTLEAIIKHCRERGIGCIAVADHGTAEGALEMRDMAPFKVIVAEEILTDRGEIMGMFLKETIVSGLPVAETIARIRAQGALVCVPHPFDTVRSSALTISTLEEIVDQVDVIEAFNARTILQRYSKRALAFAQKHGIPQSAGSDAHIASEIGNAYVEMPEFNGKDDFLQALEQGHIFGHKTNLLTQFGSVWIRLKKSL